MMMMMMMKKKNQISTPILREDYDDHNKIHKKKKMTIDSSSSSSTVPNGEEELLPEDLISEILAHLPLISLLRFKSVSKTLQSLISNPNFLRRNTVPPPGILLKLGQDFSGDSKILMISPSPLDGECGYSYYSKLLQNLIDYGPEHDQPPDGNYEKVKFKVIDSSNGLLLYSNCIKNQSPPGGKYNWYVCNPITKDYIKLPPLEEQNILYHSWAKLMFDPSLSLTYKVVIWLYDYGTWRLYVYSSDTRSWRLSVSINNNDFVFRVFKQQSYYPDFRAVLLNGVLYWSTLVAPTIDVSICYDVEKDSVWTLNFPKMPIEYVERKLFYFGVCDGGLRLIEKYYKPFNEWENVSSYWQRTLTFPSSFDVMEMNQLQLQQQHLDYQDGNIDRDLWTVKYRVNIGNNGYPANLIGEKSLFGAFILDLYKATTKARGEGEELLLCINVNNNRLVVSFNLSDNNFGKGLRNNEMWGINLFGFTNILRYTFSLFPVHSLTRLEYSI